MDPVDPRTIFPEEVWTIIFSEINDHDAQWKIALTCQLFRSIIMKPSENVWLFAKIFPLLFRFADKEIILKCRKICKDWRNVVDNYFENHASYLAYDEKIHTPDKSTWRKLTDPRIAKGLGLYRFHIVNLGNSKLTNPENAKFFKMINHPTNPFIGRVLDIVIWSQPGFARFHPDCKPTPQMEQIQNDMFRKFFELFTNLGEHIWEINISVKCHYGEDLKNILRAIFRRFILTRIFPLFPNLKRLRIKHHIFMGGVGIPNVAEQSSNNGIDNGVLETCPSLPNFEHINIDNPQGMQIERNLLLWYHSQLKYLKTTRLTLQDWTNRSNVEFPNLVELHLNIQHGRYDEAMNILTQLRAPSLKKLGLSYFKIQFQEDYRALMELLQRISIGKPHLTCLRLKPTWIDVVGANGYENVSPQPSPELCAPRWIKTLELNSSDTIPSSYTESLLRCFIFTENLNILELPRNYPNAVPYLDKNNPRGSLLWFLMPSLNIITIGNSNVFVRRHLFGPSE